CKHTILQLTPSPFAELAGFEQPTPKARKVATTSTGHIPPISGPNLMKEAQTKSQSFPAPLVLPHDALNYDPDGEGPAQTFKSWLQEKHRNMITEKRKTLYVGGPPKIDEKVNFMREWVNPKGTRTADDEQLTPPSVDETIAYIRDFYHGMPVKRLSIDLWWTAWEQSKKCAVPSADGLPQYVALSYGDAATRVRARPSPDSIFPAQLNLDDILDAAIAMLPDDAYAIVLLVDHDIYESPDDDFCAGRAYGGSRVSLVQSARYNPLLDEKIGIECEHAWPMSHCRCVVDELCAPEEVKCKPATAIEKALSKTGAMRAAVDAVVKLEMHVDDTKAELEALWASRVLRTVSHELGHTLCLAHCHYYACIMQSTSSLLEDTRQPPSLCPVCLSKIAH
ncbi:hypothetical protein BU23DRAFT_380430, partial [Bimuria novae-zelandiae CBS 107.79]